MAPQPSTESDRPLDSPPRSIWLVALFPLLACVGMHLLVAGAVLAGWTVLGLGGVVIVVLAWTAVALWRRRHHNGRCPR